MRLHEITTTHHKPTAKRVGRGISAGQGKTAGRGTKGQKARTGANSNVPRTFDGASTSMIQRLPKLRGFTSHRQKQVTVNLATIARLVTSDEPVSTITLIEFGIITPAEAAKGIKIVGSSATLDKKFTFDANDHNLIVSKKLQSTLS